MIGIDSGLLDASAPVDEIAGRDILYLTGTTGAWLVESGQVDVFAARLVRGEIRSRRRHIARFNEGAVLFAGSVPFRAFALICVPVGPCRLREISPRRFDNLSFSEETLEPLCEVVENWVTSLICGLLPGMPPKNYVELPAGEVISVEPGCCVRCTDGLMWAMHEDGASNLMACDDVRYDSSTEIAAPIGDGSWIETLEVSRLRCFSTLDRLIEGAIWDDLSAFHLNLLKAAAIVEKVEGRVSRKRRLQKADADRDALNQAVSHLANVMSDETPTSTSSHDPLLEACRMVGRACAIDVRASVDRDGESRGRLERIANASRFRVRRVALRDGWWRFDAGPLLGSFVNEDDSRSPVALIPGRSGGYTLLNPESGATTAVGEVENASLSPFGYVFYRPFGDRALNALEVLKFAAVGSRKDFQMILLMGICGGLLGLLTPIITGVIFNSVIPGAERIQLIHMIGALLACALATAVFQLVRGLAVLRVESKMDASVQSAVWDRLLNLPTTFFRKYAAGDLAMRAGGISEIRRLLSGATIASLLSGLFSAFNLALLFYYDAQLALWALALTVVALLVLLGAGYAQLRYQRDIMEAQSHLSGQILQYITGITKLRVAGAETKSYERWASAFSGQRRLQFLARRIGNRLTTFNAAFPVLSMMIIFGVMVSQDDLVMSTGDFIAFNGAYGSFTANMMAATGAILAMMTAVPIYEQARPILESLPEVTESKADPGLLTGDIEVSQVSFRYDPEGAPVLDGVSLSARSGEFVALVGPSGSGKSTILRLLLGFETQESGSIYLDGQDLSGLDIQAVRRQIGVVLQNGGMMSGDIFTNIAGSSLATMDDAWEAARMAGFDEDIQQMPMGMHTVISEGGTTLSGGQRQRLLIARAIVNRPRILYFDEATSALDNRTQAIVSDSLERLQATRIVVAHRLSTIMHADRIYVIDRGRVVQSGTYASLLEEGGVFADLVRRQMA